MTKKMFRSRLGSLRAGSRSHRSRRTPRTNRLWQSLSSKPCVKSGRSFWSVPVARPTRTRCSNLSLTSFSSRGKLYAPSTFRFPAMFPPLPSSHPSRTLSTRSGLSALCQTRDRPLGRRQNSCRRGGTAFQYRISCGLQKCCYKACGKKGISKDGCRMKKRNEESVKEERRNRVTRAGKTPSVRRRVARIKPSSRVQTYRLFTAPDDSSPRPYRLSKATRGTKESQSSQWIL